MFKTHGQHSALRHLYDQPVCPSCLKFYHTMRKMQAHLHYSQECRTRLREIGLQCQAPPGTGSREDALREAVHDRLLPPLRGQGPQGPRRPPTHFFDIDETFYDFLIALLEKDNIVETFEEQIRRHVKGLALPWTRFTNTLQHFVQNVEPADATCFGLTSHS